MRVRGGAQALIPSRYAACYTVMRCLLHGDALLPRRRVAATAMHRLSYTRQCAASYTAMRWS